MRSVRHEFKFHDVNVSRAPGSDTSIHSPMLFNGHVQVRYSIDAMMIKVIYIPGEEESEYKLGRGE